MKKIIFKDIPTLIILFFLAITQVSCYQKFYKVADNSSGRTVDSNVVQKTGKYFILRSGKNAFGMSDIALTDSNRVLNCTLDKIEKVHLVYVTANPEKEPIYKKSKGEDVVLNEVHISIPYDSSLNFGEKYMLDLKNVTKIEVIEKDKAATSRSTAFSTVGVVLGAALFIVGAVGIAMAVSGYDGF